MQGLLTSLASVSVHVKGSRYDSPCVQIRSRLPGTVWRGLIFFMTDRPHYILKCPHFPGTLTAEWFWLCVRSQCHQISRMRTFDENSCAISIMSPRSLSSPRTQHVWWDHREKSRRASTLWDCRGKSRQMGPNVNAGIFASASDLRVISSADGFLCKLLKRKRNTMTILELEKCTFQCFQLRNKKQKL